MQKPRPKEARGLRQQRLIREMSGSNEGASAPFIVSEGEKTAETLANPASDSTLLKPTACMRDRQRPNRR